MGILEDKARARVFYRYLSKIYDYINPFIWTEEMRDQTITEIQLTGSSEILDVGCGTGFATTALRERADMVHAIDQSQHQLTRAVSKLGGEENVQFYLGDAERLPFDDNAFDLVWSSGSIEYWPDPVATLRELRRVTEPGGQVIVVGPNEPRTAVMRWLANAMMLFYDEATADTMFQEAGFTEYRHWTIGPWYNREIAIVSVADVSS
jgi:demethylmenaquinone methyltransferase/2-methoxy-6-polyprenyl-1,4-benzoquinol methylase